MTPNEAPKDTELHCLHEVSGRMANSVIIADAAGIATWVNGAFTRITGYRADEIIGRRPGDVLEGPGTDPSTKAAMSRGLANRSGFHAEVLNYRKGGEPFWAEVDVVPLVRADGRVDGFMAIGVDVTERRRAREELERENTFLDEIQQVSGVGGWKLDLIKRELSWSDQTHRIHGTDPATFVPNVDRAIEFYHPDCRAVIAKAVADGVRSGTPWDLELKIIRTDERVVDVRAIGHVQMRNGQPVALYGSFQDIGDIVANRRRMDEANQQMAEAVVRAERADSAKSAFLAMMSHEIRTPMNGVLGMAHVLLGTDLTNEQRDYVKVITDSGDFLLTVINDILDFSKIEAGHLTLDPQPMDLPALVEKSVRIFDQRAREKGLRLQVEIAPDVPRWVVGDDGRVRQIIFNLIGNALKFTSVGHISVQVKWQERGPHMSRVELTVTDTGVGIPPEVVDQLFRPFVQANGASTARRFGGTGLGLSICKRLAQQMNGDIRVRSILGLGSAFVVELSLQRSAEAPSPIAIPEAVPEVRRCRILMAEDNLINQKVAQAMLARRGHEIVVVGDGSQAVDAASRQHFDIILMDCEMPVMGGLEATRLIRASPGLNQSVPIVALTAHAEAEVAESCRSAGIDAVVSKPFGPTEFFQTIAKVLRQGHLSATGRHRVSAV